MDNKRDFKGVYQIELFNKTKDFIIHWMVLGSSKTFSLKNPNLSQLKRLMKSFDLVPLTEKDGEAYSRYFVKLVRGN